MFIMSLLSIGDQEIEQILTSLFDAIMSYIFQCVLEFKLHFKPEIQSQTFGLHCMFVQNHYNEMFVPTKD